MTELPKISIVIPTYREASKPYLDLCMDGIANLNYPKELLDITIISPPNYKPVYDIARTIHHPDANRNFAQAVNYGIENSNQESKHVFLLSDDTVPTRDSLSNLVSAIGEYEMLMQATSNCDNYHRYSLVLTTEMDGELQRIADRYFRIETLKGNELNLKNSDSLYPFGIVIVEHVCFYAVLIPRSVINKLGLLDEKYDTGYEDTDYCYRAREANIPSTILLNALIWHFGGVTTSATNTLLQADKNKEYFFSKWEKADK